VSCLLQALEDIVASLDFKYPWANFRINGKIRRWSFCHKEIVFQIQLICEDQESNEILAYSRTCAHHRLFNYRIPLYIDFDDVATETMFQNQRMRTNFFTIPEVGCSLQQSRHVSVRKCFLHSNRRVSSFSAVD
jgi:hypothetical protein